MSLSIPRGARLLFRVDPLPRESPRGYLCRVAQEHALERPVVGDLHAKRHDAPGVVADLDGFGAADWSDYHQTIVRPNSALYSSIDTVPAIPGI